MKLCLAPCEGSNTELFAPPPTPPVLIHPQRQWYHLILDEAQNIKNFKSQRWQTLLTFNSQRRLLLTGTPLQNSLMELWSLMHFLMPHVFRRFVFRVP